MNNVNKLIYQDPHDILFYRIENDTKIEALTQMDSYICGQVYHGVEEQMVNNIDHQVRDVIERRLIKLYEFLRKKDTK